MMRHRYDSVRASSCARGACRTNAERSGARLSTENGGNTGCGCGCSTHRPSCGNAEHLLTMIRRLDFALVEVNLYLDTHPYCRTALSYFERLQNERKKLADRYEASYGPLTAAGGVMHDEWVWSTDAWPWHLDQESKR